MFTFIGEYLKVEVAAMNRTSTASDKNPETLLLKISVPVAVHVALTPMMKL